MLDVLEVFLISLTIHELNPNLCKSNIIKKYATERNIQQLQSQLFYLHLMFDGCVSILVSLLPLEATPTASEYEELIFNYKCDLEHPPT